MKSIRSLYKIGPGPSSSHTIGPARACTWIKEHYPSDEYIVKLYGSLAATGKGHRTDVAIEQAFYPSKVSFFWYPTVALDFHPNGMKVTSGEIEFEVYSTGGGSIQIPGYYGDKDPEVYSEKNFKEIKEWCNKENKTLAEYVYLHEGEDIKLFLKDIWHQMKQTIQNGLSKTGKLPGGLELPRRANDLHKRSQMAGRFRNKTARENTIMMSYAYAVNEENAAGELIVTAPTCGSAGVVPAVFYGMMELHHYIQDEIIDALAVAGVIGNVIKTNATISGAQGGCQAEIGSACSMAAAGLAFLKDFDIRTIERSAEIALEHHLGLTCDPVMGLVQIPCIERNAVAALRAVDAVDLADNLPDSRVQFDQVVQIMYETGLDMNQNYRETSRGGLAKHYTGE